MYSSTIVPTNFPFEFIVFDWKGTLEPVILKKKLRQKHAIDFLEAHFVLNCPNNDQVSKFREIFEKELEDVKKEQESSWNSNSTFLAHALERTLPQLSLTKEQIVDATTYFFEEYHLIRRRKELIKGAKELLNQLTQSKVPIALLRNTKASYVEFEKTLRMYGADVYFSKENTVLASDVGRKKPDPLIFQAVIDKCNLHELQKNSPKKILMVGNETEADVMGANGCGWSSALLLTTEKSSDGKADWEFSTLNDLNNFLFPTRMERTVDTPK